MNELISSKPTVLVLAMMALFIVLSLVFSVDESQLSEERQYGRMFLPLSYYTPMPTPICKEVVIGRGLYQTCE